MVDLIFNVLFQTLRAIGLMLQPFLVPVCVVAAWGLIALLAISFYSSVRDGVTTARRMHRIPCANCQFFTGDYNLKCTVRPTDALSEDAIACPDYAPAARAIR